MADTLSSGLTLIIPSEGDSNWATSIKADCFQKISEHDHTGGGKGIQIGTTAIANLAVTAAKIADTTITAGKIASDAVTTAKILDLNVTTGKIADLAVTGAKIANTTITAAQIASDAVTTAKILNSNVTLAKIANIATDRLLGRDTASSGIVEELTVGGGLEFTGTGGIQRSVLIGEVTASAGSNITTIANNAVTTAKILDGNITEAKLADDAATRSAELLQVFKDITNSNTASNISMLIDSNTSATSYISLKIMPKGGKVTHLSFSSSDTKSSGTLTIKLYKNGIDTGQSLTINNGALVQTGAITAVTFVAGDYLAIRYSTVSMVWTTGVTNYIMVNTWGHFTE